MRPENVLGLQNLTEVLCASMLFGSIGRGSKKSGGPDEFDNNDIVFFTLRASVSIA
jgi:hypothetical protein